MYSLAPSAGMLFRVRSTPRVWLYAHWGYVLVLIIIGWKVTDGFRHPRVEWPDSRKWMLSFAPVFLSNFVMALYSGRASAGYFGGAITDAKIDQSPIRFWFAAMFHLAISLTLLAVGIHGPW